MHINIPLRNQISNIVKVTQWIKTTYATTIKVKESMKKVKKPDKKINAFWLIIKTLITILAKCD